MEARCIDHHRTVVAEIHLVTHTDGAIDTSTVLVAVVGAADWEWPTGGLICRVGTDRNHICAFRTLPAEVAETGSVNAGAMGCAVAGTRLDGDLASCSGPHRVTNASTVHGTASMIRAITRANTLDGTFTEFTEITCIAHAGCVEANPMVRAVVATTRLKSDRAVVSHVSGIAHAGSIDANTSGRTIRCTGRCNRCDVCLAGGARPLGITSTSSIDTHTMRDTACIRAIVRASHNDLITAPLAIPPWIASTSAVDGITGTVTGTVEGTVKLLSKTAVTTGPCGVAYACSVVTTITVRAGAVVSASDL